MTQSDFNKRLLSNQQFIRNIARRYVKESDVDDLVQECNLNAISGFPTYREDKNFKSWLYSIIKNISINIYRKKKCTFIEYYDEQIPGKDRVIINENYKIIELLPDKLKVAFVKHKIEGYSYKELEGILHISANLLRTHVHRAKLFLRDKYQRYFY